MSHVGIEAINFYAGQAAIDLHTLFEGRGLDLVRLEKLMMRRKSVGLPCEDPVTHGVNAARPLIDALDEKERGRIELVITASESGLDFGKALSTYIHERLDLSPDCRLFEVKQACYAGSAALQMALNTVVAGAAPGAKALVIATDVAASQPISGDNYAEPAMGCGAAALLVSERPDILEMDLGASGFHSYQVMDTCRPAVGIEAGDAELSLLSYLDCVEGAFRSYARRVADVDFVDTFGYLAFHTPFAGLVRSVHRKLMLQFKGALPDEAEADFEQRLLPSLGFCMQVGNAYSATVFMALCGLLQEADTRTPQRVGFFSYGSGCASEFYSGVLRPGSGELFRKLGFQQALDQRYDLSLHEYERLLALNESWGFGVRDRKVDLKDFGAIYASQLEAKGLLVLDGVEGYERRYRWS